MYRSPVSQMSVPAYPTENLALEMKISDIHQILQEYEERRGSMIFAFKALLKELPDDRSVTDVLGEHELEMIDWMIAFDCDKAAGKHLRDLEIGNWKLRPHQVADLCEVETLKTPFLGNLVKLSNIKPELQDAKNFLDESNPRTREKDSRWKPKHVATAASMNQQLGDQNLPVGDLKRFLMSSSLTRPLRQNVKRMIVAHFSTVTGMVRAVEKSSRYQTRNRSEEIHSSSRSITRV
jgi:hypothetical protein